MSGALTDPVACFGKTPVHGDFIRHRVGPSLRAFDAWVGRAIFEGRRRPCFDDAYDAGAAVRFVYAPPARRGGTALPPLVGAFAPSRDRSGRRYPFIVAAEAPGLSAAQAPERLAPFLDAAVTLAAKAAAGDVDHYVLVEGAAAIDACAPRPAGAALRRPLGAFAAEVWGDFDDDRKRQVVSNVLTVLQGAEDGLRFPLGLDPAADAAVWLALVERLGGPTSWFGVYAGGPAVGAPNLLAYTGAPHAHALLHLLVPGTDADGVVELEARAAPPLPPHLDALLDDRALRLGDLLARL